MWWCCVESITCLMAIVDHLGSSFFLWTPFISVGGLGNVYWKCRWRFSWGHWGPGRPHMRAAYGMTSLNLDVLIPQTPQELGSICDVGMNYSCRRCSWCHGCLRLPQSPIHPRKKYRQKFRQLIFGPSHMSLPWLCKYPLPVLIEGEDFKSGDLKMAGLFSKSGVSELYCIWDHLKEGMWHWC